MTVFRRIAITAACLFLSILTAQFVAQQIPPSPAVIRIDVNLVQVDAVVTDSKGRPVTDLRTEDFEVFQDGVRQMINNVEFVRVRNQASGPSAPQVTVTPRNSAVPPPPSTGGLRAEEIRRTIALV